MERSNTRTLFAAALLLALLGMLGGCGNIPGVQPLPSSFILTSPTNTTTPGAGLSPTLMWTDASGEASYLVTLGTDSSFSSYMCNTLVAANATSFLVTAPSCSLVPGTQYFWKVLAQSNSGVTKAANAPFTFVP